MNLNPRKKPMSNPLSVELPPAVETLVTEGIMRDYTTGSPNPQVRPTLEKLTTVELFPDGNSDRQLAQCCLSGIWLLHNFLDESHSISQQIQSPEGSFWHAIMHRLEGDFSNSKYWYRSVGQHPVFETIVESINRPLGADWTPFDFVDQCQTESRQSKPSAEMKETAWIEWKSLFEYCFKNAN